MALNLEPDNVGDVVFCNDKLIKEVSCLVIQGAFLTIPTQKFLSDYIVNPVKKVSEFTYHWRLEFFGWEQLKKAPCVRIFEYQAIAFS